MGNQACLLISDTSLLARLLGITPLGVVTVGHGTPSSAAFGTALTLLLIGGLLEFIGWLFDLMRTARIQQWGRLVAVLLLGPLGTLLSGMAGSEKLARS